ncbi:hypothetical protein F6P94_09140 [Escherichia coli]|nr:hypothetical protein F6P94_09140 [Escherichia coli]
MKIRFVPPFPTPAVSVGLALVLAATASVFRRHGRIAVDIYSADVLRRRHAYRMRNNAVVRSSLANVLFAGIQPPVSRHRFARRHETPSERSYGYHNSSIHALILSIGSGAVAPIQRRHDDADVET